jgi:diacylglycerol kinase family enzyme
MTTQSQAETASEVPRLAIRPNPLARSVVLSMNPRAGWRARHLQIESIVTALRSSGFQVQVTTDLAELQSLVAAGMSSGDLRVVIAAGGDGTAAFVRNNVPLAVPMLVLPMGTENLLGRYLGQRLDSDAVVDVVENGVIAELDLGRAGDKYFLLMISAGFDAEVIRALHENRSGNISRASYFWPTMRAIQGYEYASMRLYLEHATSGEASPLVCRWLFGFNLPLYALGLPLAPCAVATDGKLDICAFERGAAANVVRYLWHVLRGIHETLPDTAVHRARSFRLEAEDGKNIPYQLDGDYGGTLPVEIEILPGKLRLLVSTTASARLGVAVPH